MRLVRLPHRARLLFGTESLSNTGEIVYNFNTGPIIECFVQPVSALRIMPHGLGVETVYSHVLWCYSSDIDGLDKSRKWRVEFGDRVFDVVNMFPHYMAGMNRITEMHLLELAGG